MDGHYCNKILMRNLKLLARKQHHACVLRKSGDLTVNRMFFTPQNFGARCGYNLCDIREHVTCSRTSTWDASAGFKCPPLTLTFEGGKRPT